MGKYSRNPSARHYKDYSNETMKNALAALEKGMSSRTAEQVFRIPRKTYFVKIQFFTMLPYSFLDRMILKSFSIRNFFFTAGQS